MAFRGGGVGFFVKTGIKCELLHKYSVFVDRIFESIFISAKLPNNSKIIVGSIYRPGTAHPNLTSTELFENFSEILSNTINSLLDDNLQFYLLGDFNIDILKYNSNSRATNYVDLLFSFGLLQVITKPTRCTDNSATLIDHVITNCNSECFTSAILSTQISDHFPIVHFIPQKTSKQSSKMLEKRDFSAQKIELFKNALSSCNWNCVENSANAQTAYNTFSDTFLNFFHLYFPLQKVKFNKKHHNIEPWMSKGLLISRARKFELSSTYCKNRSPENKNSYNAYRNIYNRAIRLAKKLFFDREFHKNRNNLKKTWDLIKFAMNSDHKNSHAYSEIFVDGIRHSDPQIVAEKFNEFFAKAPQIIVNEINPSSNDFFNSPESEARFCLGDSPVTRTEISDAISQLLSKKSEDMTGLSMYFIKKCSSAIIYPLYFIIYKSFESGIVPEQLKIAKVVPIHKSGDTSLPDNFRPISLLPNFSKILEKVMSNRLTKFLEHNNLLCKEQFGFRKSHSTLHPLVHFLNKVTEAKNQNKFTIAIFCDLRKAFDTVNHKILLKKLHKIGVRGIELKWFESYLSNRKQFVHINGKNSALINILLGVPQGSILGPLLFLIYINDLPLCNNLNNSLFADDTMLLDSHHSLPTLVENINKQFQRVISYFNCNRLALHPEKTKFILFFKGTVPRDFLYSVFFINQLLMVPLEVPSGRFHFFCVFMELFNF
jgi:Reverse transcriptase (RNA-dependent DNA polymerase)